MNLTRGLNFSIRTVQYFEKEAILETDDAECWHSSMKPRGVQGLMSHLNLTGL